MTLSQTDRARIARLNCDRKRGEENTVVISGHDYPGYLQSIVEEILRSLNFPINSTDFTTEVSGATPLILFELQYI